LIKWIELKTSVLDTLYPILLIWISFVETYDFLNPLFWYTLIGRILGNLVDTDYNNLKIKKKRRSCINLDIHHSKVFSSGKIFSIIFCKNVFFSIRLMLNIPVLNSSHNFLHGVFYLNKLGLKGLFMLYQVILHLWSGCRFIILLLEMLFY